MVVEITYDLPYSQWDWRIGFYIAMIGIASGAYLMGYLADVRSWRRGEPEHGRLAKWGYLTGLLGIAIGGPVLLSHLATPFRAMLVPYIMTNFGSWMAIGPYLLGGLGLGALLMFVWVAFGRDRPHGPTVAETEAGETSENVAADGGQDVASDGGTEGGPAEAATGGQTEGIRRVFNRVGVLGALDSIADRTRPTETVRLGLGALFGLFAAGVLLYSAMAYGAGPTDRVPMWDKTFLVPVQLLTGLGAGLAVAVGFTALENGTGSGTVERTLQEYALGAAGLLVLGLVAVLATVALLPGQVPAAEPAVDNLLTTYATLFVGGAVVLGLIVPILLLAGTAIGHRREALSPTATRASYVVAGVLVIAGKIMLALSYLLAAEFTPLALPM